MHVPIWTIILRTKNGNFRLKLNYILTNMKNQNIGTVDDPEKEWTFQLVERLDEVNVLMLY